MKIKRNLSFPVSDNNDNNNNNNNNNNKSLFYPRDRGSTDSCYGVMATVNGHHSLFVNNRTPKGKCYAFESLSQMKGN